MSVDIPPSKRTSYATERSFTIRVKSSRHDVRRIPSGSKSCVRVNSANGIPLTLSTMTASRL
jgi:hypothetical protein